MEGKVLKVLKKEEVVGGGGEQRILVGLLEVRIELADLKELNEFIIEEIVEEYQEINHYLSLVRLYNFLKQNYRVVEHKDLDGRWRLYDSDWENDYYYEFLKLLELYLEDKIDLDWDWSWLDKNLFLRLKVYLPIKS